MRCALFLALILCFVAATSAAWVADSAYTQTKLFTTSDCSGTPVSTTNVTTIQYNVLYNQSASYLTSVAYFADTAAGAYVTTVQYADQGVTITAISQSYYAPGGNLLNKCTPFSTYYIWTSIIGYSTATAAPSAPSGFINGQSYWNATTYASINTCPLPTSGYVTLQNWQGAAICQPDQDLPFGQESKAGFCGFNGQFAGQAKFSGSTCDTTKLLSASLVGTGVCRSGSVLNCAGATTFPSTTPNQGLVSYTTGATDCSNSDNLASVQLFANGQCVDKQTFTCQQTNGTWWGTWTAYSDSACTTSVFSRTQLASTTKATSWSTATAFSAASGFCYTYGSGASAQSMAFSCNFIGAASSVSVSAVALLFAAVLSLVASRQL